MQLTHAFHVPVNVDEAWEVLLDVERIAPCMPGATIESVEGHNFTGRVKVKVGPITVIYKGQAAFVDLDHENRRASIEAKGKETRGSGTARAKVQAELKEVAAGTQVTMITDLAVTGRPAQFSRGVLADVGGKLVDQFASCLSAELAAPARAAEAQRQAEPAATVPAAGVAAAPGAGAPAAPAAPAMGTQDVSAAERAGPAALAGETLRAVPETPAGRPTSDTIDLLDVAGAPVAKRLGPLLAALAALALLIWLTARARRRRGQG